MKFIIGAVILQVSMASQLRFFNDSCIPEDIAQGDTCLVGCQENFVDCLIRCNDDRDCIRECSSENEDCSTGCPCHALCPAGCPCAHYTCKPCEELNLDDRQHCSSECDLELNYCNRECDQFDMACRTTCLNGDYFNCIKQCPCTDAVQLPVCDNDNTSYDFDDIVYNITLSDITKEGFTPYFSAIANEGDIKDGMQPPPSAKEILMGCGRIDDDFLHMAVVTDVQDLFDQLDYDYGVVTEAKPVKKFHVYYSTTRFEPIGFSKGALIQFGQPDVYDYDDTTKLSAYTTYTGPEGLWRCGARNNQPDDYQTAFQIVFYYR